MFKQTLTTTLMYSAMIVLTTPQMTYTQINEFKITASDGATDDNFGGSVSISGDYAIVGAYLDDDNGDRSGSAYIFKRAETSWTEVAKLTASDGAIEDYFGVSVSISGDYAIVGAYLDDDNGDRSGSAYIFKRTETSWTEEAKLTASDGATGYAFGRLVSISGDNVIVGAGLGEVYIFKRIGTSWIEEAKLAASGYFGSSVSISGDYAMMGASGDEDNGYNSGSAYVYKRNGTSWVEEAKLTASDGAAYDYFGDAVSIFGDYAIVGAKSDDDNGDGSGSAYIFEHTGTIWTEEAKLTASDGTAEDMFGYSVSISGDYAIVGALWAASAYIFKRTGTNWTEETKLTASNGASGDRFGGSVSISGDYAIVGAERDDDNGNNSGSAYVYYGYTPIGNLSVTPDSLSFGDVLVGITTIEQVTVSNIGTAELNVSSIGITGVDSLSFSVDTTAFTLTPGDSLLLEVNFTPDTVGAFSAILNINSDFGIISVALAGSGYIPIGILSVIPDSLTFGDVLVGETIIEQLTVSNTGTADLSVSPIIINGNDSLSFSVDTTAFTLTPGDSLLLEVSFTPDTVDAFSASLNINSNVGIVTVAMAGSGGIPEILVTPLSINFGDVFVGETVTELVTVRNVGTFNLNVSSITITGVDSVNFNVDTTSFTLNPGDSLILIVSFIPDTDGNYDALLSIESNDGSVLVSLEGTAVIFDSTIITVPTNISTIQGGIDIVNDRDTVLVNPGTYVENINFNGKNIVLASLFLITGDTSYISQTVIDGNNNGSVVTFENGEGFNAVLSGFSIINGRGSGAYPDGTGGGITCKNSSNPILMNLILSGSSAMAGGGIITFDSNPHLSNVIIRGNRAYWGGGVACIYSSPSLQNVEIYNNSATATGGGIMLNHANPNIEGGILHDNHAYEGGGLYCTNSNPYLINVEISGNTTSGGYAVGGGVSLRGSNPIFINVVVSGNSTSDYGGGIYCYQSNPILKNTTISENRASWYYSRGGGIYSSSSSPTLVNSILWNDSPDEIAGSVNISYSDIEAGYEGEGNIDADPLFMDATNDDFHLQEGSPCIDAGTNVGLLFLGEAPDMGAFESMPSVLTIYPGDTDNNGVVNALDVLPIGIYFLKEGNRRDAVMVSWLPAQASTWETWASTYADANGDGVVNEKDVIAIGVNWGNTHTNTLASFAIDPNDSELLQHHRDAFKRVYNSLSGEGEAVIAMKTLLRSILGIQIPDVFSLDQNYPNPFNPRTTIRFGLPEAQPVTLAVYNIRGQEVVMLVDKKMYDAGTYAVEFDASRFSSGVYFYRVHSDQWNAIRKMVVVR